MRSSRIVYWPGFGGGGRGGAGVAPRVAGRAEPPVADLVAVGGDAGGALREGEPGARVLDRQGQVDGPAGRHRRGREVGAEGRVEVDSGLVDAVIDRQLRALRGRPVEGVEVDPVARLPGRARARLIGEGELQAAVRLPGRDVAGG